MQQNIHQVVNKLSMCEYLVGILSNVLEKL
jgi:hypothetical protein